MFFDLETNNIYLPKALRKEFDDFRKNLEDQIAKNNINGNEINKYFDEIDEKLKKLNDTANTKWSEVKLFVTENLSSYNRIKESNLAQYGQKISFKAVDKYYQMFSTVDRHIYYDTYYSELKPDTGSLNDEKYLKKKSVLSNELSLNKEILPKSGYIWIKAYYASSSNNAITSNVGYFEVVKDNNFILNALTYSISINSSNLGQKFICKLFW